MRIDRSADDRPQSGWFGKLVQVCLLVGLVGAAGYWTWQTYGEPFTRPQVKVAPVEVRVPGDADSILSAQGYLKSEKQAAIGAKVPGRVLKVYVKEGQPVAENAVLAELEHADLDETLEAMKATLEAQEASLEAMRVSARKGQGRTRGDRNRRPHQDERDFARAAQLLRGRAGTAGGLRNRRVEAGRVAQPARLDGGGAWRSPRRVCARRRRGAANRRRATAKPGSNERTCSCVRPFKGIVISKEAEEGESIMPGGMGAASGRGSVVTLADLLHLEVETDVKEDYVSRVKKDQRVSIAVAAVPNRRFSGAGAHDHPNGRSGQGDGEGQGAAGRGGSEAGEQPGDANVHAVPRDGRHRPLPE